MRSAARGFVQMELMLLIALGGLATALALPPILARLQGGTLSGWNQTRIILGALALLAGVWPFISSRLNREDERPRKS